MRLELQFFGGRGSGGGRRQESSAGSEATSSTTQAESTKAPVERTTAKREKKPVKSVSLEVERNMPSVAVSGVKEKDYRLVGKLDMNKSVIQTGDSFGIRVLGTRNHDVYGRITKVTDSSITVSASGSEYNIPTKNVEVNGRELRFRPKNSNAGWFGFVDLSKYYTRDDFKKKK